MRRRRRRRRKRKRRREKEEEKKKKKKKNYRLKNRRQKCKRARGQRPRQSGISTELVPTAARRLMTPRVSLQHLRLNARRREAFMSAGEHDTSVHWVAAATVHVSARPRTETAPGRAVRRAHVLGLGRHPAITPTSYLVSANRCSLRNRYTDAWDKLWADFDRPDLLLLQNICYPKTTRRVYF